MLSTDDHDLLRTFVHGRSDDAFRRLVDRYLGFVLGTALRQVRNRPMAEEIAQNVFAILARKADSLSQGALPAWLHRTAVHQSRTVMRSESRHRFVFAAYHLKQLEMLPPDGTAEEQEVHDWVRAKKTRAGRFGLPSRESK